MNETVCITIKTGTPDCVAHFYPALFQLVTFTNHTEQAKVELGYAGTRLLEKLLEVPGKVVPREILIDHAWAGRVVGQGSLNQQVYTLRQILNDEKDRDIIQTLPRRGYLINPKYVTDVDMALQPPPSTSSPPASALIKAEEAEPAVAPEQLSSSQQNTIVNRDMNENAGNNNDTDDWAAPMPSTGGAAALAPPALFSLIPHSKDAFNHTKQGANNTAQVTPAHKHPHNHTQSFFANQKPVTQWLILAVSIFCGAVAGYQFGALQSRQYSHVRALANLNIIYPVDHQINFPLLRERSEPILQRMANLSEQPAQIFVGTHKQKLDLVCINRDHLVRTIRIPFTKLDTISDNYLASCLQTLSD